MYMERVYYAYDSFKIPMGDRVSLSSLSTYFGTYYVGNDNVRMCLAVIKSV